MSLVALCRALPQLALATCCCCRPTTRRDGVGKESSDMQSTADYGGTGSPGAARQDCPKSIRCGSNSQKNTLWRVEARVPLAPSRLQQVDCTSIVAAKRRGTCVASLFLECNIAGISTTNLYSVVLRLLFFYQRMHTCCVYSKRLFAKGAPSSLEYRLPPLPFICAYLKTTAARSMHVVVEADT